MVLDTANVDMVAVLFDGRMVFKVLHLLLGARAIVVSLDFAMNRDLARRPGVNFDIARASTDFQVHRSGDGQSTVERAFDGVPIASHGRRHRYQHSKEHKRAPSNRLHNASLCHLHFGKSWVTEMYDG